MINTEERLRKVTLLRLEIRQYLELIQTMLDAGNVVVRMLTVSTRVRLRYCWLIPVASFPRQIIYFRSYSEYHHRQR